MVQGRTYTSNVAKLLKHLDVLKGMQNNKISPIMLHLAVTNACNLNCSFCCFANRKHRDTLTIDQVKMALDSFRKIGTKVVEFTGGGEPTLFPQINEAIDYANKLEYKMGICTNGKTLKKIDDWGKFEWVRIGLYFDKQDYEIDVEHLRKFDVEISGAYIYNREENDSENIKNINRIIDFSELNKVPTRFAINAIQKKTDIEKDIEFLKEHLKKDLKYCFLSDFNIQTYRLNNHCYMHMIKPFIFPDGWVYVCPCAEFAVENKAKVTEKTRVCRIEDIENFYRDMNVEYREQKCSFCKYAKQNEIIEDILMETEHNEFI
jgi:MoaA/NifB/PqqE/SkfB family radical SAM enzyme